MLADCLYRSLARCPLRMWTVIYVPHAGKAYSDPGARALGNFRAEANEEGFNISLWNIGPRRLHEDSF
jgi:hypothetical protein